MPFELGLRTGELRAGDVTMLLQEQPLQILRMLAEREGGLFSREEICLILAYSEIRPDDGS